MSVNNLINNMLELCEEHMNEGDYVESAKLLKTLYQKQDCVEFTFENPLVICDGYFNSLFSIVSFKQFTKNYRKYTVRHNEITYDELEYKQLSNFIELILDLDGSLCFYVKNSILGEEYLLNGNKYSKLYKKLIDAHKDDDDDDDKDYEFYEAQIYRKLKYNILNIITNTVENLINNQPYL